LGVLPKLQHFGDIQLFLSSWGFRISQPWPFFSANAIRQIGNLDQCGAIASRKRLRRFHHSAACRFLAFFGALAVLCASVGYMNPVSYIRRLRWLPQTLLAVLALTMAQTSLVQCAMACSSMQTTEHCAYCPPDESSGVVSGDGANKCVFPHAPMVDVFASTAHYVDVLFDSPLLQPKTFNVQEMRRTQVHLRTIDFSPAPPRPLNLTYCVQLK
jgi:hypothetical protein